MTTQDKWTRCSPEQMPEIDDEVNVWLDYARRQVATMRFGGYDDRGNPFWFWHNSEDLTMLSPKAWRALPTPPKKEDLL